MSVDIKELATNSSFKPTLTFELGYCTPWCAQADSDGNCAQIYGCGYSGGNGSSSNEALSSTAVNLNSDRKGMTYMLFGLMVLLWG